MPERTRLQKESAEVRAEVLALCGRFTLIRWNDLKLIEPGAERSTIDAVVYLLDDTQKILETLMHPDDREG